MNVAILFEGISDRESFEVLFKDEMRELRRSGIALHCRDYGGRFRGFVRRLPGEINSAFKTQNADKALVHIDSESDSLERMKALILQMMTNVKQEHQNNVFWVVIQRNFESILLAGCLEKERNYEAISEPKEFVRELFRKKFKSYYRETIHAPEYAAKLDKAKVLSRISGAREFQNYLRQISPTS